MLLHAIQQRCGFVTYHGPMSVSFSKPDLDARTGSDLLSVIGNRRKHCRLHYPDVEVVRQGKTDGVLLGGNITLLQHLIGTPFDWSSKDAILFIEDVNEPVYRIDRAMTHMRLAGKLQGLKAVLVGEMVRLTDADPAIEGDVPFGRDLKEIILDHVPPHVPLAFNFPCGHGSYITTLPVGASVQLNLGARGAEISFSATLHA